MGASRPLRRLAVRLGRVAGGGRSGSAGLLEALNGLVAAIGGGALGVREVASQPLLQPCRRFAPEHQALARALQAVERGERRLPAAGGVRQLLLGALALLEQGGQLLLGASARDRDGVAA